ncbi:MAG: tetratricopeptide repeat protein [Thalassovita sp.]
MRSLGFMQRKGFVALVVLALQALPVASQDSGPLPEMTAIEQAWARGDYLTVRTGLKQLAEGTDDALAHYRYGRVLLEGRGGPVDIPAAVSWLQRAVDANNRQAATLLARVFLSEMQGGPQRDEARAAKLFNAAATRGDAEAQYYLGLLYLKGTGIAENADQAFNWLLASAEQQNAQAQYELARLYSEGIGTKKNTKEGLRWLGRAADNGHNEAQFFLALAMDSGQGAPLNRAGALNWFRRAAEAGNVLSQRWLGQKYLTGDGVEPNTSEAFRWLQASASAGDAASLHLLGLAHRGDYEGQVDLQRAWQLFNAAANKNYAPSLVAKAMMLEQGETGQADLPQAVALYRKALELGDQDAALQLGRMAGAGTLTGLAPPHLAVPWAVQAGKSGDQSAVEWLSKNAADGLRPAQTAYAIWLVENDQPEQAIEFLQAAADAGDVQAQYRLGMALVTGEGLEQDYVQGHSWLNIAASGGHAGASDKRDVLNDLMTAEQIAEAQAQARAYFEAVRARGADQVPVEQGREE